jgi:hypothetical protein
MQTFSQLAKRRLLRNLLNFREQVLRQRQARRARAGFQFAMQGVGNVANLDRPGQVLHIVSRLADVKQTSSASVFKLSRYETLGLQTNRTSAPDRRLS